MIDIDIDIRRTINAFDDLARQQMPFATARALTWTANDLRKDLIHHLPDDFTVRNRWTAGSIQTKSATKTNQESWVGSLQPYMALQATGGDKENDGGERVAVPIIGGARIRQTKAITPARWSSNLAKKPKHFVAPYQGGPKKAMYRRRSAKSWRKGKRTPIQIMYIFEPSVHVRPHWDSWQRVPQTAPDHFRRNFVRSFDAAIRSAKV